MAIFMGKTDGKMLLYLLYLHKIAIFNEENDGELVDLTDVYIRGMDEKVSLLRF